MRGRRCPVALIAPLALLAACGDAEAPDDAVEAVRPPEIVRILPAEQVLQGVHLPTLDLATLNDAEIAKALGPGPRCSFRYTSSGRPVLALRPSGLGVIKLNGALVHLQPATPPSPDGPLTLQAGPIRTTLLPAPGASNGAGMREATLTFAIAAEMDAGYKGYLDCRPGPKAP